MDFIPVSISAVIIDERHDRHFIHLMNRETWDLLPIGIGFAEATAINRALQGETFPRPLTHDLLTQLLVKTECNCVAIRITDEENGTYFAEIELEDNSQEVSRTILLDARPSDAIALAVRVGIFTIDVRTDLMP